MEIRDDIVVLDVNEIYGVTSAKRTDVSLAWFKSARSNLYSAKVLLDSKQYSHTVFFLQQSIECIIKAILLENSIIDNAKSFSHSPEKALELFYVKMNSDSLKFCLKVKERMRNLRDFESRMVTMVALVNSQVKEYIEIEGLKEVDDFQVSREGALAMGLPETVIPDVVVYKFVQRKHFVLNLIYCFAVLFNTTQQSSRYPTLVGGDLLLPAKQYGLPKIVEGLITIVPWFDYILREIYE